MAPLPDHAGPVRRIAAGLYDLLPLAALWMIATAPALVVTGGERIAPHTLWYQAYLLGVAFAYHGVSWRYGGQTLGMRAWRLRIVRSDGARLDWPAVALRFAVALVSVATLGAGLFAAWLDPRRRMWHDVAAGTEVVIARKQEKPRAEAR